MRALGLEGKPNARGPEAAVPASVEDRLESLGLVEPLVAVRELHAAIRKDGESPARLGALVRGYARSRRPQRVPLELGAQGVQGPARSCMPSGSLLRIPTHRGASGTGPISRPSPACTTGPWMTWPRPESWPRREARPKAPAWVETLSAYCQFDLARLKKIEGPEAQVRGPATVARAGISPPERRRLCVRPRNCCRPTRNVSGPTT